MPYVVDETDAKILKALMEDGRRSYREIARLVGVSTPTVGTRLSRMFSTGLIRKITPILDVDKIGAGLVAIITLKVEAPKVLEIAQEVAGLDEARSTRLVTGEYNILARLVAESPEALQERVNELGKLPGVSRIETQIVTKTLKDEYWAHIKPGLFIRVNCDFCGNEIKSHPHALKVANSYRHFCCRTCKTSYKEKYGARIEALEKKSK